MTRKPTTGAALPPLPADVFEAFVTCLAGALVADIRADMAAAATAGAPRGTDRDGDNGPQEQAAA